MTAFRQPILGWSTVPDASGNVFFEQSSVKLVNDLYPHLVATFNDTATKLSLRGSFLVPKNYVGTPKIVLVWGTSATTGNVVWVADYRAIASGETLDPTTHQESVSLTTTAGGTAWLESVASIVLTAANFAVDDLVSFLLSRDGASASDTAAAAAVLFGAYFEYQDI